MLYSQLVASKLVSEQSGREAGNTLEDTFKIFKQNFTFRGPLYEIYFMDF